MLLPSGTEETTRSVYFSLLLCIPSVAKTFLSCCKGAARSCCAEQGRQSSAVASPAAPLKHRLCSFLPRPQPDDVRGPRRAALWGAEQLPGLPGTVRAAGPLACPPVLAGVCVRVLTRINVSSREQDTPACCVAPQSAFVRD